MFSRISAPCPAQMQVVMEKDMNMSNQGEISTPPFMCQGASASAPCLEPRVSNGAKAGLYSRTRSCIASGSYISQHSTL